MIELRISNIIGFYKPELHDLQIGTIEGIGMGNGEYKLQVPEFSKIISLTLKGIKPIEITEDKIINLGFIKFGTYEIYNFYGQDIQIDKAPNGSGYWFFIGADNREDSPYCVTIKYVHQLQNLFFELTGIELKM